MKQVIALLIFYMPTIVFACEWKVEVTDKTTKEIRYYLVSEGERTNFIINKANDEPFAACGAWVEPRIIDEEHKQEFKKVETGVLLCSYLEAPEYPIASSAPRFVYSNKPDKNNTILMTLLSVPDKGQQMKSLFSIRFKCK